MFEKYSLIILISASSFAFLLFIWIISLEWRLKKFFQGKNAKTLEGTLINITKELNRLDIEQKKMAEHIEAIEKRLKQSIQTVNTVRFNPFENSGSNQSFAIALLDENGDGVVISSLYSRDKVNVYAKPIVDYKSEYRLSNEEKEAIGEISQ